MTFSYSVSEIGLWPAGYKPCFCRQPDAPCAFLCFTFLATSFFGIRAPRLSSTIRFLSHDDNDSEFISSPPRGTDSAPRRICMPHHCGSPHARDQVRRRTPLTCVRKPPSKNWETVRVILRKCATLLAVTTQCSNQPSRRRPAHDMLQWFCAHV